MRFMHRNKASLLSRFLEIAWPSLAILGVLYAVVIKPALAQDLVPRNEFERRINEVREDQRESNQSLEAAITELRNDQKQVLKILIEMKGR